MNFSIKGKSKILKQTKVVETEGEWKPKTNTNITDERTPDKRRKAAAERKPKKKINSTKQKDKEEMGKKIKPKQKREAKLNK